MTYNDDVRDDTRNAVFIGFTAWFLALLTLGLLIKIHFFVFLASFL